jgi:hypothetical protein
VHWRRSSWRRSSIGAVFDAFIGSDRGADAVVCSWSLLFAVIIAAIRQKLHLSARSNLRGQLSLRHYARNLPLSKEMAINLQSLGVGDLLERVRIKLALQQQGYLNTNPSY